MIIGLCCRAAQPATTQWSDGREALALKATVHQWSGKSPNLHDVNSTILAALLRPMDKRLCFSCLRFSSPTKGVTLINRHIKERFHSFFPDFHTIAFFPSPHREEWNEALSELILVLFSFSFSVLQQKECSLLLAKDALFLTYRCSISQETCLSYSNIWPGLLQTALRRELRRKPLW